MVILEILVVVRIKIFTGNPNTVVSLDDCIILIDAATLDLFLL